MNSTTTEKLLAEALEEKEQHIKELTDKVNTLTGENKTLNAELKKLSEKPQESSTHQSMVTWEDFQKETNVYRKRIGDLAVKYLELKAIYDKLSEERRYWATQQWAKHLFRWLFLKRHLWIWLVYIMFLVSMSLSVYFIAEQKRKIQKLQSVEMKYRFIRATNAAPTTLQYLDDAFEGGDAKKFQIVCTTVKEYEKALIQKSDSIIRAERRKAEELR